MSLNKKNAKYYYDEVQKLLDKYKVEGGVNWNAVCLELFNTNNPVVPEQELNSESADYMKGHVENSAWTASLYLMAWVLYNFKMKTQDGHCRSSAHGHGTEDPKCNKGSNFHNKLYMKCFKSFEDILKELEKDPPKLIS